MELIGIRVIKFRAWDKEKKRLLPITRMNWSDWWVTCEPLLEHKPIPLEYGERNSFKNEKTDRHILMQYTGLKDKNGKEIYEGDIIEALDGRDNNKSYILTVEWEQDVCSSGWTLSGIGWYQGELEVIGNIYENPELINQQNNT